MTDTPTTFNINAIPPSSWDEDAVRSLRALAAQWDARAEHNADQGGDFWKGMAAKGRECANDLRRSLAVARERQPVKPDREAVARAMYESSSLSPYSWEALDEFVQNVWLDQADAALALWPGRSEAEVKREGAVEALRSYAADLNLHRAVEDGWEKYGDDLCGDDPDPCLFWDMTHAEQKRINDRADRLAAEGGADRG